MTETETHANTFMGIPVVGEITDRGADQRTEEEFAADVQALLAFPTIQSFGWRQYTPYFNDGEPCYFRTCTFWVSTTSADDTPAECARCHATCRACAIQDDGDIDNLTIDSYGAHPVLGGRGSYRSIAYEGKYEAEWTAAYNLMLRMDTGVYNAVLLKLFGDHATITVTRERIVRESYEHD